MPKLIKTNQIKVRLLKRQDLAALNNLYADDQLLTAAGLVIDANPNFKRLVLQEWIDHGYIWGIFAHQLLIGTINLFPGGQQLEIGYLLMPEYQHNGIMTVAVGQLLQRFSRRPLFAKVRIDNRPSQRVLQKNGFKLIGTEQGWMRFLKKK